jgi:hypothetical protein
VRGFKSSTYIIIYASIYGGTHEYIRALATLSPTAERAESEREGGKDEGNNDDLRILTGGLHRRPTRRGFHFLRGEMKWKAWLVLIIITKCCYRYMLFNTVKLFIFYLIPSNPVSKSIVRRVKSVGE